MRAIGHRFVWSALGRTAPLLLLGVAIGWGFRGGARAAEAVGPVKLELRPIYRVVGKAGEEVFMTRTNDLPAGAAPAFLAVLAEQWPAGLAPIFVVEKTNRVELRRRPPTGEEGQSDPLFFALPPEDEPDAGRVSGRWQCVATRPDRSRHSIAIELAMEGAKVVGRFDPSTDYRFAHITGGSFEHDRIELRLLYIADSYVMEGRWLEGGLRGEWRQAGEAAEHGTWELTRSAAEVPADGELVALYQWRRQSDGALRHGLSGEPGWERAARPLGRVWRAAAPVASVKSR